MNNPYAAYHMADPAMNMQYMQQMQELQMQQMYASQVQTMQAAPAPTPSANNGSSGSKRYTGRIKSFSDSNGYGFITSPEITAIFSMDIFVHQLEVDKVTGMPGAGIPLGTTVSFAVVPNKKGQPQARDLRFEFPIMPTMGAMNPHLGHAMGAMGQMGQLGQPLAQPMTQPLTTPLGMPPQIPMVPMMYPMPGVAQVGQIPHMQPNFNFQDYNTMMTPGYTPATPTPNNELDAMAKYQELYQKQASDSEASHGKDRRSRSRSPHRKFPRHIE